MLIAALAAIGGAVPAAWSASPDPIIEGEPADVGEYPAQGFLQVDLGFDGWSCGGTLLSARLFLTAAHCATDFFGPVPPETAVVALGELDLDDVTAEDLYDVEAIEVHEDYGTPAGNSNDVALLTLEEAAPFQPLPLVGSGDADLWDPGTVATIVGWGNTTPGGNPSDILLEAEVPIVTDDSCDEAYEDEFDATTMVCAADGVHDTCQGDSGGPFMVPNRAGTGFVLAGVTSWGIGCAELEHPGVYARAGAPALNAWIASRVAASPPPPPSPPPPLPPPPPSPPPPPPPTPPPAPPPPAAPPPPPAEPAPRAVVRCAVPRLRGMTIAAARRALVRRNCRLGKVTRAYSARVRFGRVSLQRPAAGRRLVRGAKVSVVVSRGRRR